MIIAGSKGLLRQYALEDDFVIIKHVKDHDEMKRRSTLADKQVIETVVKQSGFAQDGDLRRSSRERRTTENISGSAFRDIEMSGGGKGTH